MMGAKDIQSYPHSSFFFRSLFPLCSDCIMALSHLEPRLYVVKFWASTLGGSGQGLDKMMLNPDTTLTQDEHVLSQAFKRQD